MKDLLEYEKRIIMENGGNKLILLDGCNLVDGVCMDKIIELFPKFINNSKTFGRCYIIELKDGEILYE